MRSERGRDHHGNRDHQSGDRRSGKDLRRSYESSNRAEVATRGLRVSNPSADVVRGARKQSDACRRDLGKRERRVRSFDDARNGQASEGCRGRGNEVCHRLPLLRGECPEIPGRRNCGNGGEAQFYPLSSDWPYSGHHALELPLLAGVSFCRARADGRQCRTAEARFKRSAVRAED